MKFDIKFYAVVLVCLAADQISKYLVRTALHVGDSLELIKGIFNLTYVTNTGISFGLFKGNNLLFILVSIAVLAYVIYSRNEFRSWLGIALVISGILGNLTDRIFLGSVVDFIHFSFWPIFNFADSYINVGVVVLVAAELMRKKRRKIKPQKEK